MQGGLVNIKLNSGSDVTIIAEATLNQMKPKLKLKPVYLVCLGQFIAQSIIDGQPLHCRVIVAKTTDNLLSHSVAVKMGFMKRVYVDKIQDVYGDIGILQCDPVKILLRDNATPYSVCTARPVSIPLLPQVEVELRRMEDNGIIERVTEPTDWCAPMVPVMRRKKQGAHLCQPKMPERVRDVRETHFTYLGRRATQINRLDSLLETGCVNRIFADPFRPSFITPLSADTV